MANKRTKTIAYRRAVWFTADKKDLNLEALINDAHAKLKRIKQRQFKRLDGQLIQSIKHLSGKTGTYVHVVSETPGDHASTLAVDGFDAEGLDVDTSPPPAKREYMDGDILAFVKGNHVCICSTGLRDSSFTVYCQQLFDAAKLGDDAKMFDLVNVADADKLKLIEAQGVKSIDIKATLLDASVKYIKRNNGPFKALGLASKHISAVLGRDKAIAPDNLTVLLEVTTDDRLKGKVAGAKSMKEMAKEVIEGEDDYVIITRKNQRISKGEIYMRQVVQIDRHGKSVVRNKAWGVLEDFYKQLVATGAVKQ